MKQISLKDQIRAANTLEELTELQRKSFTYTNATEAWRRMINREAGKRLSHLTTAKLPKPQTVKKTNSKTAAQKSSPKKKTPKKPATKKTK